MADKKKKYIFLKVIAAATVVFIALAAFSFPLKTVYYTVSSDEVAEPVRIAHVSDLHSCYYGKEMSTLLGAISDARPDLLVMTGDMYDDVVKNDNTRIFMKAVGVEYESFYIAGNHENWLGSRGEYRIEMEGYGITVLEGDNVSFGEITICGAANASDGSFGFSDSVDKCAEAAGDGFNLLLAHYPENIDYYLSKNKFDLILAGHAHGGQWRIPGVLNGLYAPGQGLFPEYAGGRYDFDSSVMIVSRGLSRVKDIIPRIFNNPELVVIDVVPSEENNNEAAR